jgi:hypothetical protein
MTSGSIEVVSPVACVGDTVERLNTGIDQITGLRVGLLDNSMPHAGDFLRFVAEVLADKYAAQIVERRKEGRSARSAGQELLDDLAANCDVAITGFGV